MLEITLGTNTSRVKKIVDGTTILRTLLEDNKVNYGVGSVHIDGCPIAVGDLDKSLTGLGITAKAFIIVVAKIDNAKK